MKKLNLLLAALVLALLVVLGVIVFKQWEYKQSAEYYEGLRNPSARAAWRCLV